MSHQRTRDLYCGHSVVPTRRGVAQPWRTASVIGPGLQSSWPTTPAPAPRPRPAERRGRGRSRPASPERGHRTQPERWAAVRRRGGARWLLTVDQDSTLAPDHLDDLLTAARGRGRPGDADRRRCRGRRHRRCERSPRLPADDDRGIPTTQEVIQTGTLWAVDAVDRSGRIRRVAGDRCRRCCRLSALRSAGLSIVVAPDVESSIGSGTAGRCSAGPRRARLRPQSRATHHDRSQPTAALPRGVRAVAHPRACAPCAGWP